MEEFKGEERKTTLFKGEIIRYYYGNIYVSLILK